MELRRLRGLSPSTTRQLFTSTVAPVVDYACSVWMHAFKDKLVGPINRVQRIGAQEIVGTFLTVATSIAAAEAHIASTQDRFWRRAVKLWTDIHICPIQSLTKSASLRKLTLKVSAPLAKQGYLRHVYRRVEVVMKYRINFLETQQPAN
jgi:hypothetical protein